MALHRKGDWKNYEGFTLIEILVVVGLIAILAAVTIVAINPAKNFEQTRDAQRSADVTAILNAVTQYTSEQGNTIESLLAAIGFPDADTDGDRSEAMICPAALPIGLNVEASPADEDGSSVDDDLEYVDLNQSGVLVDEYIVTIPEDPSQAITHTNAAADPDLVDTGYEFCVTTSGRVTVSASPERASSISVSR